MGTRHLTIVQKDGEYKVAQYGQWDGYPEGAGLDILRFCKEHLATQEERDTFGDRVNGCEFITSGEAEKLIEYCKSEGHNGYDENYRPKWAKIYPQFSRDTGNEILGLILNTIDGLILESQIDFIKESLFCEWAWVIDLDKNTFEAYVGFNTEHLNGAERFYKYDDDDEAEYKPCKFVAEWSLDELPTEEDFLNTFKELEE